VFEVATKDAVYIIEGDVTYLPLLSFVSAGVWRRTRVPAFRARAEPRGRRHADRADSRQYPAHLPGKTAPRGEAVQQVTIPTESLQSPCVTAMLQNTQM
jgi:hypothetical protein